MFFSKHFYPSLFSSKMLISATRRPSTRCCHLSSPRPPFQSLAPSSFWRRPDSKNPILTPRLGSKSRLGGGSMDSGHRGDMTELARFAAVGRGGQGGEEDGGLGEAEAILGNGPSDLGRGFAWRDVESVLNRMSKWMVAALFGLVISWKHDAEILWAAMGSVINSCLSITLGRILNHERPVSGLRSDPGMPSSHAQSIFYAEAFAILSMIYWLGLNLFTVTIGSITFVFGSYLSWLRVSQQLHTFSQALVGVLLGSTCGIAWFWLWDSFVLRTFISSIWVWIVVVLGSVTFCMAFMVYAIRHWLKDEL